MKNIENGVVIPFARADPAFNLGNNYSLGTFSSERAARNF